MTLTIWRILPLLLPPMKRRAGTQMTRFPLNLPARTQTVKAKLSTNRTTMEDENKVEETVETPSEQATEADAPVEGESASE